MAEAITMALKSKNTGEVVSRMAFEIDKVIDQQLLNRSEGIQAQIVEKVLLPLCRELTKDSKESRYAYHALIAKAFTESDTSLRRDYPK